MRKPVGTDTHMEELSAEQKGDPLIDVVLNPGDVGVLALQYPFFARDLDLSLCGVVYVWFC
jgi:hypothetical protein